MVQALKPTGAMVFVVFNRSRNPLKDYLKSEKKPRLRKIPDAEQAWKYGDIYIIPDEVKFREYTDGSIIFFPKTADIPRKSPIGRAAYAVSET